jgi:hypothetical protein
MATLARGLLIRRRLRERKLSAKHLLGGAFALFTRQSTVAHSAAERLDSVLIDGHFISKLWLLGALADKVRRCHHREAASS